MSNVISERFRVCDIMCENMSSVVSSVVTGVRQLWIHRRCRRRRRRRRQSSSSPTHPTRTHPRTHPACFLVSSCDATRARTLSIASSSRGPDVILKRHRSRHRAEARVDRHARTPIASLSDVAHATTDARSILRRKRGRPFSREARGRSFGGAPRPPFAIPFDAAQCRRSVHPRAASQARRRS